MTIRGLIWLEEVIEKLASKHRVEQYEVRSVLLGRPRFRFVEKGHKPNENVCAALGRTEEGRYLIVFFIRKLDGRALVLSARDMTDGERKRYEKK